MDKIRNFEKKITNYKNELFALRLFYEQAEILWPSSILKSINFEKHYNNIINRGNEIIKKAEKTLKDVKVNHNLNLFYEVEFPPLEKDMMLLVNPDGIERLKLLFEAYNELFPERDKDIPLTEEEHKLIMNRLTDKF
ncbi:MAG TPA: hypothetical protein VMZ91_03815 [Candidatus Paceibacterota bacterium]|nr:hypothetical protein [Candidatus Paceibacterota bacterium]